jgi:hypothetical protein
LIEFQHKVGGLCRSHCIYSRNNIDPYNENIPWLLASISISDISSYSIVLNMEEVVSEDIGRAHRQPSYLHWFLSISICGAYTLHALAVSLA